MFCGIQSKTLDELLSFDEFSNESALLPFNLIEMHASLRSIPYFSRKHRIYKLWARPISLRSNGVATKDRSS